MSIYTHNLESVMNLNNRMLNIDKKNNNKKKEKRKKTKRKTDKKTFFYTTLGIPDSVRPA